MGRGSQILSQIRCPPCQLQCSVPHTVIYAMVWRLASYHQFINITFQFEKQRCNRRTKIANLHGVLSSTKVHDHRHMQEYKVCFVVLFFLVTSGRILWYYAMGKVDLKREKKSKLVIHIFNLCSSECLIMPQLLSYLRSWYFTKKQLLSAPSNSSSYLKISHVYQQHNFSLSRRHSITDY